MATLATSETDALAATADRIGDAILDELGLLSVNVAHLDAVSVLDFRFRDRSYRMTVNATDEVPA